MFDSYFGYVKNPENHWFVKALGENALRYGDITGVSFEREELIKFVALAYYKKHHALFLYPPGHQVEPVVDPRKREGQVDETKAWVAAVHVRTSEAAYGQGKPREAAPNYDVLDLCVLRMEWLVQCSIGFRLCRFVLQARQPLTSTPSKSPNGTTRAT